jgi:dTMP kinase
VSGYTLLQENVSDEFRGRTFATLTVSARIALFVALAGFPAFATAVGNYAPTAFGQTFDLSGTRVALTLGALIAIFAGLLSRRGLKRSRLARPRPLALLPRLIHPESPGKLIVFEGVEGSGKGTQIQMARNHLVSRGREVVVTREPGGTEFGDRLRETILSSDTGRVDARAEALLFAASRAHLVSVVIRPALAEGKIVLCDRFVDSSLAYQGAARGLGEQDILTLNAWATQGLFPDAVVLLHLEPEEGLARAEGNPDRIESEDLAFHAKVADAYLRIAEEHPERFEIVDASGTPEDVHGRVRDVLDRVLERDEGGRAGAT